MLVVRNADHLAISKVVYGSSGYTRTFQLILKQSPLIEVFRHLHRTMQDNFHLLHRSVRHAPPNQQNSIQALCALLRNNKAHEFERGRTSYKLTDHMDEGINKMQSTTTSSIGDEMGSGVEPEYSAILDGIEKEADGVEVELELDDLEAE